MYGCGGGAPSSGAPGATAGQARSRSLPTSSPAQIKLVAPTVQPLDSGSSGLPAPSGVTASRAAAPTRLRIPAIGVDSTLGQLDKKADGTMDVPSDFNQPGWYARGPAPGEKGPAVILGHLDSYTGPAVFWRLSTLHAGDVIEVDREDGSKVTFKVTRIASFSVDSFPTAEIYGPSAGPELRLITCGGTYSLTRRQYLSNVVAFAST
jgi:sortase (surface protein transpeptidase)